VESAAPWNLGSGTIRVGGYTAIVQSFLNTPGFVRSWDEVAKVPSLYNATTKEWVTYEDSESVRLKGEYVAAQRLHGAMFWELSNDDGSLLDGLRRGLRLPAPAPK
jgi:chitinase